MGKLGLKLVFWKSISSHTHVFLFLIFNALRYVFKKSGYFSKKMFFQIFNWSNLFFDQSKSLFKILVSLCLVRLIEPVFRSIEHRESSFFFKTMFDWFKTLFQIFFKLSSLSPTWQGSTEDFFVVFNQIFARFFSHKTGKTFIPFILFFFSWFHA